MSDVSSETFLWCFCNWKILIS